MITELQVTHITNVLTQTALALVQEGNYQRAPEILQTIRRALVEEYGELNRAMTQDDSSDNQLR